MPSVFPRSCKWDFYYIGVRGTKNSKYDFDFAAEFFGISDNDCNWLFMPESYRKSHRGPISVAKRIRKFVELGQAPSSYKHYEVA